MTTETLAEPREIPANVQEPIASVDAQKRSRRIAIILAVVVLVILALFIFGIIILVKPTTDTARIRDIMIIIMALESLLIGLVLSLLVIQLARLINLLQNEIQPILESTNETVNTLRGTTTFISDNLVEPVIKLNEYLAAFQQLRAFFGLTRRRKNSKE